MEPDPCVARPAAGTGNRACGRWAPRQRTGASRRVRRRRDAAAGRLIAGYPPTLVASELARYQRRGDGSTSPNIGATRLDQCRSQPTAEHVVDWPDGLRVVL